MGADLDECFLCRFPEELRAVRIGAELPLNEERSDLTSWFNQRSQCRAVVSYTAKGYVSGNSPASHCDVRSRGSTARV
jgi:hypothetical protein